MTSKPLEIIVDQSLYNLPIINNLVAEGHTIRELKSYGYNLILGPKVVNLTAEDLKTNPKLLDVALKLAKDIAYPGEIKPSKKGKQGGMEDQETSTRETTQGPTSETDVPTKRKRGRKPGVKKAANGPAGELTVDSTSNPATST